MKKLVLFCFSVSLSLSLLAQIPEDAIKFSWQPVNGSARINAIGGAMGSLGGDISAISTNPAGLAFFKGSDLVFSPGMSFLDNKSNYRGTAAKDKISNFNLGPSGIVFGLQERGKWDNKAISIGVTRTADFRNNIYYTGFNDFSSFGEQYAIEAAEGGANYNDLQNNTSFSFGTRMAFQGYYLDTVMVPGRGPEWVSMAMYDQLRNGGDFYVQQSHQVETKGGITQVGIGYAASMDDKIYVGGSLGIDIVSYTKNSVFREEDATGSTTNYFNYASLAETFTTKGFGLNLKLGAIIKPSDVVRLGLAIHSPSVYSLKDTYDATLTSDAENFRTPPLPKVEVVNVRDLNGGQTPVYKYEMYTPWRVMVSGSYVLREVQDVKQQKGFLTADIEYAHYRLNRYRNPEDASDPYYKGVNTAIKDYYKGAFNFRVGGELKFNVFMTRLGFAYYGSPYRDKELTANKMYLSGGLGYRNKGIFVDVTYVHGLQKDVIFPYRLSDKANTFASTKTTGSNVMLTLGFKI